MNKAFKRKVKLQPNFKLKIEMVVAETNKRVDVFSCDICEDNSSRCYCLAA